MSSPQDPSERFQLSDSFASLGDPVEGNPFAVDDPLHQVWLAATRKAEEEVCRITFSALLNLTPSTAQRWPATFIIARFDAWAQRGASVCGPIARSSITISGSSATPISRLASSCGAASPIFGRLGRRFPGRSPQPTWRAGSFLERCRPPCLPEHQSAPRYHPGLPPDAALPRWH